MPESFVSAFLLLFLVIDPLGNTVLFHGMTKDFGAERARRIILRECFFGTAVLVVFAFLGESLLRLTGVSHESLGLTGGVLLFLIGMSMLYRGGSGPIGEAGSGGEPFFVPLAVPLFAGPSSIALTVLNASPTKSSRWEWMAGMLAACAASTLILVVSGALVRRIGARGVAALERLMGLLLTVVAVQMILDGFRLYWSTLRGVAG